jgi:hypothetical protein
VKKHVYIYIYIYIYSFQSCEKPRQNCTKEPPIWLASQPAMPPNQPLVVHRAPNSYCALGFSTIMLQIFYNKDNIRWRESIHIHISSEIELVALHCTFHVRWLVDYYTTQGFPTQIKTCFSF